MKRTPPPTIDMLPDGSFRPLPQRTFGPASDQPFGRAPQRPRVPFSIKLGLGAALVAVAGLSLTVAALAIYLVSLALPVIIIAGGVAWAMYRYRRWQAGYGRSGPVQPRGFGS